MDSRQSQFPATFPDTFKNFFSLLSEDDDHVEQFSHLLEDKVIPRLNKCRFRGSTAMDISSVDPGEYGERNYTNTTNFGRSNSFRVARPGNDYCKHMKYCCLHQNQKAYFLTHDGRAFYNVSDDEKGRKHFGKLTENDHENDSSCENCDDSDTTSTCSSNNATSYSCLLRRSRAMHGFRRTDVGTQRYAANVGTCSSAISTPCSKYTEQQNAPSSSSTPTSINKFLNDKNNFGCSKPTDRYRMSRSPAFRRRRASSIAATHISTEQRYPRDYEPAPWRNSHAVQPTRFMHQKPPANTCPNTYKKTVDNVGSNNTANIPLQQRQRQRTSSMPAENRKPRLADTRRAAIHCADMDLEYYRLRSFSITSHGVCNLGDSMRSRRSRSINSVTSNGTANSGNIGRRSKNYRSECEHEHPECRKLLAVRDKTTQFTTKHEKESCCGVFDNDADDDDDDDDDNNEDSDSEDSSEDKDDDDDDDDNDCFYNEAEKRPIADGPSGSSTKTRKSYDSPTQSPKKGKPKEKPASKMSIRTKYFLTSILKFKRSLRVKRRHSNSCSDLFVI